MNVVSIPLTAVYGLALYIYINGLIEELHGRAVNAYIFQSHSVDFGPCAARAFF
jgi:hypothetical protein